MDFTNFFSQSLGHLQLLLLAVNAILHIIFASGVAQDIQQLSKLKICPRFIPGVAWVLATLLGGILVLGLYWLIHHSTLARRL